MWSIKYTLTEKLSNIEEADEEFTENHIENNEKDESFDYSIMLKFDEDGKVGPVYTTWTVVLYPH